MPPGKAAWPAGGPLTQFSGHPSGRCDRIESDIKFMTNDLGRGDFMKQTGAAALLAAPAVQSARGANDKVNIGWIGLGTRGYYCLEKMYIGNAKNVHVGAVCDTFTGHLARGKDRVQTTEGSSPKAVND